MFGIKKKKKEEVKYTANGVKKIKVSELPPEKQAQVLADLQEIGDRIAEHYEEIMRERLDNAKAVVEQGVPDNREDR